MNLTREEQLTFPDLWEQDMRRMIPDFEILDNERMLEAIDSAKEVHGMKDASDLRVIVRVIRRLEEQDYFGKSAQNLRHHLRAAARAKGWDLRFSGNLMYIAQGDKR